MMTPVISSSSSMMRPHTIRGLRVLLSGYLRSASPSRLSALQVNTWSSSRYGTELTSRYGPDTEVVSADRRLEADSQVMVGRGWPSTSHCSLRGVLSGPELASTTERSRI